MEESEIKLTSSSSDLINTTSTSIDKTSSETTSDVNDKTSNEKTSKGNDQVKLGQVFLVEDELLPSLSACNCTDYSSSTISSNDNGSDNTSGNTAELSDSFDYSTEEIQQSFYDTFITATATGATDGTLQKHHTRAISLPSSLSDPLANYQQQQFINQSVQHSSTANQSLLPCSHFPTIANTSTSTSTYTMDAFVRASSYREIRQSPATSFLSELAELTAAPPFSHHSYHRTIYSQPVPMQQCGRYVFIRVLAHGTFSTCWLAHDVSTVPPTAVAIKVYGSGSMRNAMHEIRVWERMHHCNVLQLLDWFVTDVDGRVVRSMAIERLGNEKRSKERDGRSEECVVDERISTERTCQCTSSERLRMGGVSKDEQNRFERLYAVSPIASKGSLLQLLERRSAVFSLNRVRRVFQQIVEAVRYLHDDLKIVHRDIKLENVLIDSASESDGYDSEDGDEDKDRVLLCDFGLSLSFDNKTHSSVTSATATTAATTTTLLDTALSEDWLCAGSLQYCAPETFHKPESPSTANSLFKRSVAADCWSLGVLLYALVKGCFPFDDEFVPRLKMKIEAGEWERTGNDLVDDLLERLLDLDAERRFGCLQILQHPLFKLSA